MNDLLREARELESELDIIERQYRRFYSEYKSLLDHVRFNCRDCDRGARTGFRSRIDMDRFEVCNITGMARAQPAGHCINCLTLAYKYMKVLQWLEEVDMELTERLNDIQDSINYRW